MASLATYDLGRELWQVGECVAYEARDRGRGVPVIVKVGPERPAGSPRSGDPILRECEVRRALRGERFGHCLARFDEDGRSWAVLPWFGGTPLGRLLGGARPGVQDCLAIAGAAALLLDHLHAARWTHGQLTPASLLWCERTRELQFADLGTIFGAGAVPDQAWRPPSRAALRYAAPERLFQADGATDYRADLYSLGAILYELLTGLPPFPHEDPVALARAHRVGTPPAPDPERVPAPLWAVVRQCLEKLPAARYASGGGLEADLARCREQLRAGGRGTPFELRSRDVPSQLRLSTRLYGRGDQLAELRRLHREADEGAVRLALVCGEPGIGKTALVNALRRDLAEDGGTFISGKYAQYHTDQPYVGIAEALRALIAPKLSASPEQLDAWRRALDEVLGEKARVIGAVLPELGIPAPAALPAKESRNRFLASFVAFLRHSIRDDPPLVLFLDDLQWMDGPSQELIAELLEAPGIERLLVVGAYRSDEVAEGSPLARLLAREGPGIARIALPPLGDEEVEQYLADTFCCPVGRVRALARGVREKTASNPFFMARFIEGLYDAGRVRYEPEARRWGWDDDAIANMQITRNVVPFMEHKLRQYPAEVREALCNIACLGGGVSVGRLSLLLGVPADEVLRRLQPAAADGVLLRERGPASRREAPAPSAGPRAAAGAPAALLASPRTDTELRFRFSHDKVEEAAYFGLLDDEERERLHLAIGRHLLAHGEASGDDIFLVTKQYDRWLARHALPEEDDMVAGFYVEAGRRAKAGNAYESARECFESADRLLGEGAWQSDYPLVSVLHREWAEIEYLLGSVERSRGLINKALQHCRSNEDEARLIVLLIDQHTANAEYQEAIILGRNALADLGFERVMGRPFPKRDIARVLEEELDQAVRFPVDDFRAILERASETDDAGLRAMMSVLMSLIPPTYFTDRKLNALVATFMARLTYEQGFVCESTAKGISNFGNALAEERGMYRAGYLFARLALRFAEQHYPAMVPRILYSLAGSLNHWVQHLRESEKDIATGIELCEAYGDRNYNGYLRTLARCQNGIYLGTPLAPFKQAVGQSIAFVERARNTLQLQIAKRVHQAICELDGTSPARLAPAAAHSLPGAPAEVTENPDNRLIRCIAAVLRVQNAWFLGRLADARLALVEAMSLSESLSTEMTLPMLYLFSSLVDLATLAEKEGQVDAGALIARVQDNQQRLFGWAEGCPENFQHAYLLVEGSLAAAEGRTFDAIKAYSLAAECAAANGFRQFEGMAHELLARQWQAAGQERYAHQHLRAAAAAYEEWGAIRVLERLLREHPQAARQATGTASRAGAAEKSGVLEGGGHADQAELAMTLTPVLRVLAENGATGSLQSVAARQLCVLTGARRCLLFVCADDTPRLVGGHPEVAPDRDFEDLEDPVRRLVRSASRSGEIQRQGRPARTPAEAPAREGAAMVAVPVSAGGGVVAIAYLENESGAMDLGEGSRGLLRIVALLATGDVHARLHEAAARSLAKLTRFLPAHVHEAVLARQDESAASVTSDEIGIAFFDLRGFTDFQNDEHEKGSLRLLEQYRREMGEIVREHGATTDHWEGDGCMVFVAAPVPVAERVTRLVDMTLALRRRARELITEWDAKGHRLGFGIGAAYGFAEYGILGTEARWDYSATGRYVSLASRLCDAALDGQILVHDPIHAALGSTRRMEDLGKRTFKGFNNPVGVFNVVG